MKLLRAGIITLCIVLVILALALTLGPARLEGGMNTVTPHPPYPVSEQARELHKTLVIGDWHSDSTLWKRDLLERSDRGHVDIPRMREGNQAVQMFTSVTKSPSGQNYDKNSSDARDNITSLVILQAWPPATWNSLSSRALYQAEKLQKIAEKAPDEFILIRNADDLETLLSRRARGETIVGGILGTEGSHALDGDLANIETLYKAGFRMMSLQHFFDNKLGGSLHGESGAGLTEFGRQAVDKMQSRGIMIDVSHSAPQVVEDVLARSKGPLIVSHTGFYGHCQSPRNISDELMQKIAEGGGIIAVGYWDGAICDPTPKGIIGAIRYGIELVGVDHVALGSDYDGSISAPFDASELSVLTHEMLKANFSETEIRKIMGGNMMRYLAENLPAAATGGNAM
jgi:microsomal dipeptidase-like Zn-dependent dipeptidase